MFLSRWQQTTGTVEWYTGTLFVKVIVFSPNPTSAMFTLSVCDQVFRMGADIRWPDDVVTILLFAGGGRYCFC